MKDAQDRKTQHMEDTIDSHLRAAKRSGDDKKLKQAASRRKKLDERTGLEVSATGGRFKLNRDLVGTITRDERISKVSSQEWTLRCACQSQRSRLACGSQGRWCR